MPKQETWNIIPFYIKDKNEEIGRTFTLDYESQKCKLEIRKIVKVNTREEILDFWWGDFSRVRFFFSSLFLSLFFCN